MDQPCHLSSFIFPFFIAINCFTRYYSNNKILSWSVTWYRSDYPLRVPYPYPYPDSVIIIGQSIAHRLSTFDHYWCISLFPQYRPTLLISVFNIMPIMAIYMMPILLYIHLRCISIRLSQTVFPLVSSRRAHGNRSFFSFTRLFFCKANYYILLFSQKPFLLRHLSFPVCAEARFIIRVFVVVQQTVLLPEFVPFFVRPLIDLIVWEIVGTVIRISVAEELKLMRREEKRSGYKRRGYERRELLPEKRKGDKRSYKRIWKGTREEKRL